jgi:putative membrane protein
MRLFSAAMTFALLLASPLAAQIGNPAGVEPGTPQRSPGTPAPDHANTQDRLFARLLAAGGMAEVDFGKIADAKAQSSEVKEFARRMVQDHTKAGEQLTTIARAANISLPRELDPDHKAMRDELDKATGAAFDRAYMQGQIVEHQKAAILLQYEIGLGQDAQLQRYAADTLPAILEHLELAKDIWQRLGEQTAQANDASGGGAPERGQQPRK